MHVMKTQAVESIVKYERIWWILISNGTHEPAIISCVNNVRAISMKIATENPKIAFLLIKRTFEEYRTIRRSTFFSCFKYKQKMPLLFVYAEQCCTNYIHVLLCKVYSHFMMRFG